ncbi:hypothetical protein [Sphingomonas sp. GC_Shp_3]|uniref:hypothetical protein n=1 Tax=Sphingomonas sp. GC_Shp_3 TaxID=2937383 RepID=UPI002269F026|nr:hypothetical protein [Sphingomonas sp. GC_Shp_3]
MPETITLQRLAFEQRVVFAHDVDIILNADDKAVYLMRDGVGATPVSFAAYARAAQPLIEAARGRTQEAPNPHERLSGRALI